MTSHWAVTPEAEERCRLAYLTRLVPIETCAAMVGLPVLEFLRFRRARHWPPRKVRHPTGERGRGKSRSRLAAGAPVLSVLPASGSPIDRIAVGRAMERFIAGRIAAFEAQPFDGDVEPERTARTVAHYARALGLVRDYLNELEKERSSDGEPPARSLSDLRDELRRHLERIWDEGEDGGGLGGACPDAA
jgi:hypothetical protein